MTTIIIRLKNLLIFGLVLLSLSLVWVGITGWEKYRAVFGEKEQKTEAVMIPPAVKTPATEPTVTIVAQEQKQEPKDNFFSEYRIERERKRSERVEILREIVNNPNSSAQMRQEAQQQLMKISDNLEKESKIENGLIAKGFKDAVVVIQPENVMVIVPANELRQEEIARIADIVMKVAGCKMENVVIVPKA